ncbi:hypothetical protein BDR05DRAFT_337072 [Suillus weaverae]|nr:hypothetical protein BDR05DRAFT_337072 [Suillus weaverae]
MICSDRRWTSKFSKNMSSAGFNSSRYGIIFFNRFSIEFTLAAASVRDEENTFDICHVRNTAIKRCFGVCVMGHEWQVQARVNAKCDT